MTKEVTDKYNLVGIKPGKYQFQDYGTIDLNKMSLSVADQLFAAGFPHLEKKKKKEVIDTAKN